MMMAGHPGPDLKVAEFGFDSDSMCRDFSFCILTKYSFTIEVALASSLKA